MSRIGETPISRKEGLEITHENRHVQVSGPKGTLSFELPSGIELVQEESQLRLVRQKETKDAKANHGLARSIVSNMVHGVTEGYRITLEIQGVGYRADASGQTLNVHVGYSHPVSYQVPDEVSLSIQGNNQIILESCNKEVIGQTAANIRAIRRPDAYKGKGIRYAGEEITLKEGKSVG